MEGYNYGYASAAYPAATPDGQYVVPDHGDGFGDYYGKRGVKKDESKRWPKEVRSTHYSSGDGNRYPCYYAPWGPPLWTLYDNNDAFIYTTASLPAIQHYYRASCSKNQITKREKSRRTIKSSKSKARSRSRSGSRSKSRSRSNSRTRQSRSGSRSQSGSASRSQSNSSFGSRSRRRQIKYKEPSILDAFRVMYLTPSKHRKSSTKFLATKKKQDRIQQLLKSDGLGSKHWFFYPRNNRDAVSEPLTSTMPGTRDNCDQRVKVDGGFFRKYKKSRKVDENAPAAKLKRWELILYQKLGFVQAV